MAFLSRIDPRTVCKCYEGFGIVDVGLVKTEGDENDWLFYSILLIKSPYIYTDVDISTGVDEHVDLYTDGELLRYRALC